MAYPTPQQIAAKAAEKGFRVGSYVHMSTHSADVAGPIREFNSINGQVQVVWMDGACRNLLNELRLSSQHRLPYQFPAGYELFSNPQLVAEAIHQARTSTAEPTYQADMSAATAGYTAVRVKGYGCPDTDTWVTTDPNPQGEGTVYRSIRPQPAPASYLDMSPSMEIIFSVQTITAADVAHWMDTDPKQGGKFFKEMQRLYGAKPTMLDLAMYSGATMLAPVVGSVMAARKQPQGK